MDRIQAQPPLVVGPQAYRRAPAKIDVDDVMSRIACDPDEILERAS